MWLTNNKTKYSAIIMLVDVLIINLSIIIAYLIRFKLALPAFNFEPYVEMSVWISLGAIFFFNTYHLYSISARTRWDDQFYSIILAVSLTLMLTISLTYISANYSFPRSVFLLSWLFQVIIFLLWRYLLWKSTKRKLGIQKAILIGDEKEVADIAQNMEGYSDSHIEIIGLILVEAKPSGQGDGTYKILGPLSEYEDILTNTEHDIVVVTPSLYLSIKEKIVSCCYTKGKEVFLIPDLYETLLVRANLSLIDDIPVFSIKDCNGDNKQIKRSLDLIIGTLAFIISLPIMLILAFIIKIDSKGPIIYKQDRVTKGGKVFTLYKFRSMVMDAENKSGPVFAAENDQRATRVGKVLRKTRLDELPQFINVIKGDMSLVGPRPERPFFVEQYSREIKGYENRHRMKPGITGIAQIAGKYNTGPREKLVLDLLYAKKNDVMVDLQIILHTVKVLFMRDKAS